MHASRANNYEEGSLRPIRNHSVLLLLRGNNASRNRIFLKAQYTKAGGSVVVVFAMSAVTCTVTHIHSHKVGIIAQQHNKNKAAHSLTHVAQWMQSHFALCDLARAHAYSTSVWLASSSPPPPPLLARQPTRGWPNCWRVCSRTAWRALLCWFLSWSRTAMRKSAGLSCSAVSPNELVSIRLAPSWRARARAAPGAGAGGTAGADGTTGQHLDRSYPFRARARAPVSRCF